MKNSKLLISLLLSCVFLVSLVLPVLAVNYNSGVSTGQFVKYGNFLGSGIGFEDFNNIDFMKVMVTNVDGNQVTLLSTGQYKNGTAMTGNNTSTVWDVAAGTQDGLPTTQGTIIAANLNIGDAIPPANTYTVNLTESRTYLGVSRTVNVLSVGFSTPDYNTSLSYVYDRASGILLETSVFTSVVSDSGPIVSSYSYSVVETNIFGVTGPSVPENDLAIVEYILVFVVVASVVIVLVGVLLRRHK
ncbi:MAG TPA: hypothetical protein VLH35_01760 [Candidatus Acidoferrales bacterium]|nr:hypothetical protein [Candidatus Acidoferrales bacterium]